MLCLLGNKDRSGLSTPCPSENNEEKIAKIGKKCGIIIGILIFEDLST